jgi:hypothetical protein
MQVGALLAVVFHPLVALSVRGFVEKLDDQYQSIY